MSDRIDELVAICTKQMNACNGCPNLLAITELATIAREAEARALEAEAMCERLVKFAADCGECPRTRYDEDEDGCRECLDSIRRSARKVVARSDHTYG